MTAPSGPPPLDAAARRALAVGLYNRSMDLQARDDRTPAEDDELLHMAHASRFHWGEVGTAVNLARGEWLCARVYAVLGRGEPATWHARRCLELLDGPAAGEREDWDLAAACEAMARASAVAGDGAGRDDWIARARTALADVADPEDRAVIELDLSTIP